ncbi:MULTISPECIES: Fic/DOC family protein [Nocardiopsis]|uniref:protein adenylyltransferase n=1 Tax=Nocardiopsis sinuspersici TaxID=501010 RepID=A0A1V3BWK4_9ACTN|nr:MULTISPECIES: Fic family protein [Nocardiopsis]OOC52490.1 hypothetical protein NOSIN_00445 [Nocardiopsis sinuspersici]
MASPEPEDPYLQPDTGRLRNKLGIYDKAAFDSIEGDLVGVRALQLEKYPPPPTGDLAELQAIHRHLFQDLYDWAGHLRCIDMQKAAEGAEIFLPFSQIERAAYYGAEQLRWENMLRDLPMRTFIARLAYYYDWFNHIHPFREGNGRTQRFFWNRIAHDAGWALKWKPVVGTVNDRACQLASEGDLAPLEAMFTRVVAPRTLTEGTWVNLNF